MNILKKTPNFGRIVHTLDYALNLKLEFLILQQLRLDSRIRNCMIFCFSLSVAASNFQSKSDICPTFSPPWSWWPIYGPSINSFLQKTLHSKNVIRNIINVNILTLICINKSDQIGKIISWDYVDTVMRVLTLSIRIFFLK